MGRVCFGLGGLPCKSLCQVCPSLCRHEQVLRDRRLKRRVELMTVRSAIATLQRELQQLQAQKKAEAQANR